MKIHQLLIIWGPIHLLTCAPGLFAQSETTTKQSADSNSETIVAIRHGEKPDGGLGNLNCKGLNRALALPGVLLPKYGEPQFIFAPNPTERADGGDFNYIGPLTTIEPTAVRCQLSINTEFGYTQIDDLAKELGRPEYQHAVVFIAWEHVELDKFAKRLIRSYGGDPGQVPFWSEKDYDTIFVFKIRHEKGRDALAFTIDHEELVNLSDRCP
jgi:hypothetical protein